MISQEIRRRFLRFFQEKGHTLVSSSPVVPAEDPSLLFINAGMNQFKDLFLGQALRDYTRAATAQKCIRVGGKHNDLENVGHTARHLTFFEMLGNFSFGDYFKKEAIDFAWEVSLSVFQFPPERLWATVFYEDEESFNLWQGYLPSERIIRMGEKDNFWAMGDTGPCGPCSELYFDRSPSHDAHKPRSPAEDPEGSRFLEFWNLVFMQYNRTRNAELVPLPKQSVDTGAGLERVVALKMGVDSLFETDLLRELIAQMEAICTIHYAPQEARAAAFRVIADHTRMLAFALADGVQPSNTERGYVLRKVLRRAVRYGRQLGVQKPFLAALLPRLTAIMGEDFPELAATESRSAEILTLEEEGFLRTLRRGGDLLTQIVADSSKRKHLSGEEAFTLKDTYGLPLEEIILLAKDAHLTVDLARFEELEKEAKERSRGLRKEVDQGVADRIYEKHRESYGPSLFLGYQQLSAEAVVLGLLKAGQPITSLYPGEEGIVLLDQTPFYAEKGGQCGDQGRILTHHALFEVLDCTTPFTGVMIHAGLLREGELHVGDRVTANVDPERRRAIANNHTATHLLHWALRELLGPHVKQAGSLVEPARLRFDFTHSKALSSEEIAHLEDLVNRKICENTPVHSYEVSFREVERRRDILQFFGERYGSLVRVVDIDFSKELCGGTHTHSLGSIGYFRITKEGSIGSGVRRLEAVTGVLAEAFSREEKKALTEELVEAEKTRQALQSELQRLQRKLLSVEAERLLSQQKQLGSFCLIAEALPDIDPEGLKICADLLSARVPSLLLLLIGKQKERCHLLTRASSNLVERGVSALALLKEVAPLVGGKGGGKPEGAQGSGTSVSQISQALEYAYQWAQQWCEQKSS